MGAHSLPHTHTRFRSLSDTSTSLHRARSPSSLSAVTVRLQKGTKSPSPPPDGSPAATPEIQESTMSPSRLAQPHPGAALPSHRLSDACLGGLSLPCFFLLCVIPLLPVPVPVGPGSLSVVPALRSLCDSLTPPPCCSSPSSLSLASGLLNSLHLSFLRRHRLQGPQPPGIRSALFLSSHLLSCGVGGTQDSRAGERREGAR